MGLTAGGAERWVALLRAINVGGHTVKMEALRELFAQLGLARVETFIASGNVIFAPPAEEPEALERRVERHLRAALGYEVATFVRSAGELAEAALRTPYDAAQLAAPGHRLYVGFLPAPPGEAAGERLAALCTPTDELAVRGRELYWLCRIPSHESSVTGPRLEKALGMPTTMRNITTVRKLAAKYAPGA